MEPSYKTQYDTLPIDVKERVINVMQDREFVFSENGEIAVYWKSHAGPRTSTGEWTREDSQKHLSINIDNTTSDYDYEFLSPALLSLRPRVVEGFLDNLYLRKISD